MPRLSGKHRSCGNNDTSLESYKGSRFWGHEQEPNYCSVLEEAFSEDEELGNLFPISLRFRSHSPNLWDKKKQQEGERK